MPKQSKDKFFRDFEKELKSGRENHDSVSIQGIGAYDTQANYRLKPQPRKKK